MQVFKRKGFTLVELLVSIGVLAVVAAGVAALVGTGPRMRARDTQRRADLQKIAAALELYKADLGSYPGSLGVLATVPAARPYLSAVPRDPSSGAVYGTGNSQYSAPGGATFHLCTDLETIVVPTAVNCNDYFIDNQ